MGMYAFVDGVQFIGSVAGFVIGLYKEIKPLYISSAVFFIVYPIINQLVYNAATSLLSPQKEKLEVIPKSRFVYSDRYNISFCGIQKFHPFDSQKYRHTYEKLVQENVVNQKQIIIPGIISRNILLEVMSKWYLLKLCFSIPISSYVQMPIFFLPSFLLRWRVLDPMLIATQGTLLACQLAMKLKWAVNLSGGYHHAHSKSGGGFCVYPDITLAIHYVKTRHQIKKVMIIDLDAHQGNGHQRDFTNDQSVFIVDCYNHGIYPRDLLAKNGISQDISVHPTTSDDEYLESLKSIEISVKTFQPQFILYNAGTDTLVNDPLGGLNLSKECHIKRDQFIIEMALKHKIPIIMVLSGGYQKSNAQVIAQSITNLNCKYGSSEMMKK